MVDQKISYPEDWELKGLGKGTVIDEDAIFHKNTVLDLSHAIQKNYMIWYLKQYEIKANINNTLKTFIEKGWKVEKDDLFKPTATDFKNKDAYEAYQSNAQHLYSLYSEWDATQTTIEVLRLQILDLKRFPKNG